ncbi:hypothetical protein N7492_010350 [Penicillium capsulatum]|uniref:S-adenosyl-L-methionine-dependent methyltransferase n=1 Tax=Penicillium capsulatum TaxID=69766 RepID=A0A9W9HNL3_9EURO|nr:hypothetical protein N7492_010350 [Penicillium capsulatum]KAJ6112855.1 hypothetical protein N7512_008179 [Penicillium capsulatum]
MEPDDDKPLAADRDQYILDDLHNSNDADSDTTSLASRIYRGVMKNGRRYQTIREDNYWCPADEQQFECFDACHLVSILLDSETRNPLFQAPIKQSAKNILDIGTGRGNWAIDVADMFPHATVRGVDLYPPPVNWMPPNCILEVDNILENWTWREPFDFVHISHLVASFTPGEWDTVYKQAFDNLNPGGWIEQLEADAYVLCDDGSLPPSNILHSFGSNVLDAAANSGHPGGTLNTMRASMEKAGFVDLQERTYKWPIGPWPRDKLLKEAGQVNYHQWVNGLEGWCMFLLTKFGTPEPWSPEEVQVYVARLRQEVRKPEFHIYHTARRVWGRKPEQAE